MKKKNLSKKMLSIISIIMCLAITVSSGLFGCTPPTTAPGAEVVDESKSQLLVGVFDAGLGTAFIESAKAKFEAKYADVSFEPNKKGVQVIIDPNRGYAGSSLTSGIKSNKNEIFFSETVDYYTLVSNNLIAEITDAVTKPLTEYGETESIQDKMYEQGVNYFKTNDKYYGVPFYESYTGIVYDAELFDTYSYYIGSDGSYVNAEGINNVGEEVGLSAGPDGNPETTWDNGLPATYDEFFAVSQYMSSDVTPYIWAGQFPYYANWVATSLWADYEGAANMYTNFNVSGTATDLIDTINADGTYTLKPATTISEDNYYLLGRQAGRYHAANFLERVVRSGYYDRAYSFSPSTSQLGAQQQFLYSNRLPGKTPIAMLFEGTWWENEASGTFSEMASKYANSSKQARKLGFMPLPKVNESKVGSKQTLLAIGDAAVVVNATAKAEKMDLIKTFIRFIRTDEMLADFTAVTSVALSYDYDISEEIYNSKLTYFGRTVWDAKKNSDIVYPTSSAPLYLKNQGGKLNSGVLWDAVINGNSQKYMVSYYDENSSATAVDYFNGIIADYEAAYKK